MSAVAVASPVRCFDVEVVAVRRLSRSFLRVTLGGPDLAAFDDGGPLGPRDQRVKLVVPAGGGVTAPGAFDPGWYPRWLGLDPLLRGEMRTYTVRSVRPGEVDVDFVLHGDGGPASAWATGVRVGDRVVLLGPNRHSDQEYGGIEWAPPPPPSRVLLVGDETAVPAVASILATLPAGYTGHAVLEVPHPEDFLDVRTDGAVTVGWLARGARRRGALLGATVRTLVPPRGFAVEVDDLGPEDLLWETPSGERVADAPYAWVAGEAAVVRDLRRYLVGAACLPRGNVTFMGYWRDTANPG